MGDVMEQVRGSSLLATVVDSLYRQSLSTGLHFHYCPREGCAVDSLLPWGPVGPCLRNAAPGLPSALSVRGN